MLETQLTQAAAREQTLIAEKEKLIEREDKLVEMLSIEEEKTRQLMLPLPKPKGSFWNYFHPKRWNHINCRLAIHFLIARSLKMWQCFRLRTNYLRKYVGNFRRMSRFYRIPRTAPASWYLPKEPSHFRTIVWLQQALQVPAQSHHQRSTAQYPCQVQYSHYHKAQNCEEDPEISHYKSG